MSGGGGVVLGTSPTVGGWRPRVTRAGRLLGAPRVWTFSDAEQPLKECSLQMRDEVLGNWGFVGHELLNQNAAEGRHDQRGLTRRVDVGTEYPIGTPALENVRQRVAEDPVQLVDPTQAFIGRAVAA